VKKRIEVSNDTDSKAWHPPNLFLAKLEIKATWRSYQKEKFVSLRPILARLSA
jgi:hypothetical protein